MHKDGFALMQKPYLQSCAYFAAALLPQLPLARFEYGLSSASAADAPLLHHLCNLGLHMRIMTYSSEQVPQYWQCLNHKTLLYISAGFEFRAATSKICP